MLALRCREILVEKRDGRNKRPPVYRCLDTLRPEQSRRLSVQALSFVRKSASDGCCLSLFFCYGVYTLKYKMTNLNSSSYSSPCRDPWLLLADCVLDPSTAKSIREIPRSSSLEAVNLEASVTHDNERKCDRQPQGPKSRFLCSQSMIRQPKFSRRYKVAADALFAVQPASSLDPHSMAKPIL